MPNTAAYLIGAELRFGNNSTGADFTEDQLAKIIGSVVGKLTLQTNTVEITKAATIGTTLLVNGAITAPAGIIGNTSSTTKLKTGRTISLVGQALGSVVFDGTKDVAITTRILNSETTTKLQTARTISLSGDASGSVSFDGSSNANIEVEVINDSHNHDDRYLTEAESNIKYLDISGDTMSGDLTIEKSLPRIILDDITGVAAGLTAQIKNNVGDSVHLITKGIESYLGTGAIKADNTPTNTALIFTKGSNTTKANGDIQGASGNSVWGFGKVYNSTWNDVADFITVEEDTPKIPGKVYVLDTTHQIASKYAQLGSIGLYSDTYGFGVGTKKEGIPTIPIAVAGFVLAYTDKIYPSGTPLVSNKNGDLTKANVITRLLYSDRILGNFYKVESAEEWHGIKVDSRHWVKVK